MKHRRKQTKTRRSTKTIYTHTNEGMRCRWGGETPGEGKGMEEHWKEGKSHRGRN